jgi:hypothetical protein
MRAGQALSGPLPSATRGDRAVLKRETNAARLLLGPLAVALLGSHLEPERGRVSLVRPLARGEPLASDPATNSRTCACSEESPHIMPDGVGGTRILDHLGLDSTGPQGREGLGADPAPACDVVDPVYEE